MYIAKMPDLMDSARTREENVWLIEEIDKISNTYIIIIMMIHSISSVPFICEITFKGAWLLK